MNTILRSAVIRPEWRQRLRTDRPAQIRLTALLVTVLLHGLVFWWGMNSARLGAPSSEKISAIRVFLQPLTLPELAAPPRPALPPPAAIPAVARPPVVLPQVAAPPPSVVPAPLVSRPAPVVVAAAPEPAPAPEVAMSLAPLPAVAVAPALATAAVSPGVAPRPAAGENGEAGSAGAVNTGAGGGPAGAVVAAPGPGAPAVEGAGAAGTGKELYLRTLFAHIEARKYYPPSARRRHLEGQVRVSFTIDADGGVSDLKASEGHPQLEEAARQTVRSALPLPLPAGGVTLPFALSYRMDFRLR